MRGPLILVLTFSVVLLAAMVATLIGGASSERLWPLIIVLTASALGSGRMLMAQSKGAQARAKRQRLSGKLY